MDVEIAVDLAKKLADLGFEASVNVRLYDKPGGPIAATVTANLGHVDLEKLRAVLAFIDEQAEVKAQLTNGELGLKLT